MKQKPPAAFFMGLCSKKKRLRLMHLTRRPEAWLHVTALSVLKDSTTSQVEVLRAGESMHKGKSVRCFSCRELADNRLVYLSAQASSTDNFFSGRRV